MIPPRPLPEHYPLSFRPSGAILARFGRGLAVAGSVSLALSAAYGLGFASAAMLAANRVALANAETAHAMIERDELAGLFRSAAHLDGGAWRVSIAADTPATLANRLALARDEVLRDASQLVASLR